MNEQVWWHLSRAGGVVAWFLLALSVAWGLFVSTRLLGRKPGPAWMLDLHRFLGGLALVFTIVHLAGLVADNYVHFGTADLLLPFASSWKTGPVATGVFAFWILLVVELTSLVQRRLPRRVWHSIHLSSLPMLVFASFHGTTAGTDVENRAYRYVTAVLLGLCTALVLVRLLVSRRKPRSNRIPDAARVKVAA